MPLHSQPQIDSNYLRRALDLARQGIGLASPNPNVGAVLVDTNGTIVGEGVHTFDGIKHAEVLALEQAGDLPRGTTLYINLEPCSHHGRTGPCADALIKAGVKRVVACMQDPNPAVSGKGFQRLREAGVELNVGIFQSEAKLLNEAFAKYIRTGEPLITLKSAMTLDGKIAPAESGPYQITGEAARAHVQELRHRSDAILVGIGTVRADDPLLTDRSELPRRRRLLRVILDSQLQLPLDSRLVKTAENDVLAFHASDDQRRIESLRSRGICLEKVPQTQGLLDLRSVIGRLASRQITSLLVEGGSRVNTAFLANQVVDKVFLYYAPKILGEGVPFLATDPHSPGKLALGKITLYQFGPDFAVEGYMRDPYGEAGC